MTSVFVITLGDVVGLTVGILICVVLIAVYLPQWWRVLRCKHDNGVHETSACDAICKKCGKNLGFIGAWRDKQRVKGE